MTYVINNNIYHVELIELMRTIKLRINMSLI